MALSLAHQPNRRTEFDLTELGFPEVPLIGAYVNAASTVGLYPHSHAGILEICYLVSGEQLYRVGDRDYQLRGNDVFVTFPGELHSTGNSPQSKGLLFWIQIQLPRRPTRFLGQAAAQSWPLIERLRTLPSRHFRGTLQLKRVFEEILNQAGRPDELTRLQIGVRIVDWLLGVVRCAERAAGAGQPNVAAERLRDVPRDLRRVCEALAREPEAEWPVERMAELARLSPSRFKAKFKERLGLPPREYLLRLRIDVARERLRDPNTSITELAYALGFSSSQYFATVFKRYTLRRPSDDRSRS